MKPLKLIFLCNLFLFCYFDIATGACIGKEKWLPRVHDETYAEMIKWHTPQWLAENKMKITTKKQLIENFHWLAVDGPVKDNMAGSYKFSIDQKCDVQVSRMNYSKANEIQPEDMNHVLLAGGDRTITAGVLNLFITGGKRSLAITPGSHRFCPPFSSLKYIKKKLISMGWTAKEITLVDSKAQGCK